jgi:hypothetical protein
MIGETLGRRLKAPDRVHVKSLVRRPLLRGAVWISDRDLREKYLGDRERVYKWTYSQRIAIAFDWATLDPMVGCFVWHSPWLVNSEG